MKKHITYKKYLFFINKLVVFLEFLLAKDNYIYGLDACLRRHDTYTENKSGDAFELLKLRLHFFEKKEQRRKK